MVVTNTQAYYTATITAVKSFIVPVPGKPARVDLPPYIQAKPLSHDPLYVDGCDKIFKDYQQTHKPSQANCAYFFNISPSLSQPTCCHL